MVKVVQTVRGKRGAKCIQYLYEKSKTPTINISVNIMGRI